MGKERKEEPKCAADSLEEESNYEPNVEYGGLLHVFNEGQVRLGF